MKLKKSLKANLEKKKSIFFQIGLVISLAAVLTAFEWTTPYLDFDEDFIVKGDGKYIEEIQLIRPEPPEKPKPPVKPQEIEIVPDDKPVDDPLVIWTPEDKPGDSLIYIPPFDVDTIEELPFNYFDVQEKPVFPLGGEDAITKWVSEEFKTPKISIENGSYGKAVVQFVIDKKGNVTNVEVVQKVDPFIDAEALRVVKSMPKWKPGKQNGIPVEVTFYLPIKIKIY